MEKSQKKSRRKSKQKAAKLIAPDNIRETMVTDVTGKNTVVNNYDEVAATACVAAVDLSNNAFVNKGNNSKSLTETACKMVASNTMTNINDVVNDKIDRRTSCTSETLTAEKITARRESDKSDKERADTVMSATDTGTTFSMAAYSSATTAKNTCTTSTDFQENKDFNERASTVTLEDVQTNNTNTEIVEETTKTTGELNEDTLCSRTTMGTLEEDTQSNTAKTISEDKQISEEVSTMKSEVNIKAIGMTPGNTTKTELRKAEKELVTKKTKIATKTTKDGDIIQKSNAELRNERRAIQEAQRAAKEDAKQTNSGGTKPTDGDSHKLQGTGNKTQGSQNTQKKVTELKKKEVQVTGQGAAVKDQKVRVRDSIQLDDEKMINRIAKKLDKQHVPNRTTQTQKKVSLFRHLHQYEHSTSLTIKILFNSTDIHPAIIKLGLQYAHGIVCGSNARCVALLHALKQVISDYCTPPDKELARDLEIRLKPCISFLNQCRQLSVSMGNAIKHVKHHINTTPSNLPDDEAKQNLINVINKYCHERILLAAQAISEEYAFKKINNGDVILVYACSSIIRKVLFYAHDQGKKFTVIVADGRPKLEGRVMLRHLVEHGIKCSYVLINAVSYVMKQATQVLLGAHAILANGCVMSRVGTAQVALIAKSFNVPVLVCCETYKFCERVQTDSFVFNELGDPDDLVKCDGKAGALSIWRDLSSLYVLNLVYDVTPHELISIAITDIGMIPPTAVPAVLRVKSPEG